MCLQLATERARYFLGLKLQLLSDSEQCFLDFSCTAHKPELSFLSCLCFSIVPGVSSPAAHIIRSRINRLFIPTSVQPLLGFELEKPTTHRIYWDQCPTHPRPIFLLAHFSTSISRSDWFSRATFNTDYCLLEPSFSQISALLCNSRKQAGRDPHLKWVRGCVCVTVKCQHQPHDVVLQKKKQDSRQGNVLGVTQTIMGNKDLNPSNCTMEMRMLNLY